MFKLMVLSCLAAAASAALIAPYAYTAPLLTPYNYRGPLSLAPGQPASILAADGRPLDTLDVNLDRSAHYTAKALDSAGLHVLKKRSVVAPLPYVPYKTIAAPYHSAHLIAQPFSTHIAQITPYSTPITHYW